MQDFEGWNCGGITACFEGWNCGGITACGKFGQICGGYNAKGKWSDITKTFYLPAGTYSVELDFIKIDSWCVCLNACGAGLSRMPNDFLIGRR